MLKSPAIDIALRPVRKRQAEALREHKEALEQYELMELQYQKTVQAWRRSKLPAPPTKPERPAAERLIVSDTTIEALASILEQAPGVQVWTDRVPTPLDSAGIDDVLGGRIRETVGTRGGINLWAVGDNLRKGAALNAVQIAELLV